MFKSAIKVETPPLTEETPISNFTTSIPPSLSSTRGIHPYRLGASLYMPATRTDIWAVISRAKLPNLNSVIICLEDAVSAADIPQSLHNIEQLLAHWAGIKESELGNEDRQNDSIQRQSVLDNEIPFNKAVINSNLEIQALQTSKRPLVFIRPRDPHMLMKIAGMANSDLIDGYVLPKVDMDSLSNWRMACQQVGDDSLLMPTLETGRLFDPAHNQDLATALGHAFDERVFALRIGGNDLFSALRLRRPSNQTIYETPIGTLMHQLIGTFATHGYYLTAPVCEYFDSRDTGAALFMQELATDVSLGLVGKTVIHPSQIALVQQAFCVPASVLGEAEAILAQDAKAVFKYNNTMLEPATHYAWATEIIARAKVFGVIQHGI